MTAMRRFQVLSLILASLLYVPLMTMADDEAPVADPTTEAAEPEIIPLGIGDPAPAIAIDQWVMGEAVEGFEDGQVYVVEFWATWCGPCLSSMPHLASLQEEYGDDVHFIGVTREDDATVQGFLDREQSEGKTWRDVITYRLALDAEGATNNAYMRAAGQNGIPTAFIVGTDGCVEWIGHPMTMDEPLAMIRGGNWDRVAAIAEFRSTQRVKEAMPELNALYRDAKYDDALAMLDNLEAELGGSSQITRLRLAVLQGAGRIEEAGVLQAQMVEEIWDDSSALNEFAWGIASGRGERNLELALKAAMRASELTDHEDASILDTLARAYFEQGNLEQAIEWQRKAVAHNEGNATIDAALERYLAAQAELAASDEEDGTAPESETTSENP